MAGSIGGARQWISITKVEVRLVASGSPHERAVPTAGWLGVKSRRGV